MRFGIDERPASPLDSAHEVAQPLDGYGHASYARALADVGTPRLLPRAHGWLLERPIPGAPDRDAMGCYPLFACEDWAALAADLEELDGPVAVSLVTDPFGIVDEARLRVTFPDVMRPFKRHFVCDLARAPAAVAAPHRRKALRALEHVTIERCEPPTQLAEEWAALYANLVTRHGIRGIAAFSADSLGRQLAVPGALLLRARAGAETVGAILWYRTADVAYYHLGAYSDLGYELEASFALFWHALQMLRDEVRWLALGAGAGVRGDESDGLTRFKRGWATETRPVYFCGRILDPARYAALAAARGGSPDYFPAYRAGEFR